MIFDVKAGGGVLGVKSVAVWVAEGEAEKVPGEQAAPQSQHLSNNKSTNGSSKSSNRPSERTRYTQGQICS